MKDSRLNNNRNNSPYKTSTDRFLRDFDRDYKRASRFATAWFIFIAVFNLALLAGAAWLVFVLLNHFGII